MYVSGIGQAYEITKVINDYEAIYSITKSLQSQKNNLVLAHFVTFYRTKDKKNYTNDFFWLLRKRWLNNIALRQQELFLSTFSNSFCFRQIFIALKKDRDPKTGFKKKDRDPKKGILKQDRDPKKGL